MSEILMPIFMYIIILLGGVVFFTSFFIALSSILGRFHQDELPHLEDTSCK